jgi:hypothetical protein
MLAVIIGALVLWALYIAAGTFMSTMSVGRAVMVLLCMGAFVGFWLLLLWTQGRSKKP